VVKLHPLTNQSTPNHHITINDINLQLPLSNLYSHGYLSSSNQSTFNDLDCTLDNSEIYNPISNDDERLNSNQLNNKSSSYHIYKYSRRERDLYYSRLKRAIIKKNVISPVNKFRSKEFVSSIYNQTNFLINIPTKINSRQRIPSNSHHIYPLLLSPNFYTLVQYPTHHLLKNYLFNIQISFNLIHSIASQEFQTIVNNYDNQQQFSYSSLSFLNILRQTMFNYSTNLHTTFKRNYFQSFHSENDEDNEHESTMNHDNGLSIPPLKIRRYDDSSYEIDKRSVSSSASSSSGMSITQIHNGQQHEDRRRFETRPKKFPSRISDIQINSNLNDNDKKDIYYSTVGSPLENDLSIIDQQQSKE
jgi:hypothetical protein